MIWIEEEDEMPRKKKVARPTGPPLPEAADSIVLVAWEDATSGGGDIRDAAAMSLPIQYSVGMVRHAGVDKLVLAGSHCSDPDCAAFGEPTAMPASLVRRVWVSTGWKEADLGELPDGSAPG